MGCGVYIMGVSELGMSVKIPFDLALPPTDIPFRRALSLECLRYRQMEGSGIVSSPLCSLITGNITPLPSCTGPLDAVYVIAALGYLLVSFGLYSKVVYTGQ